MTPEESAKVQKSRMAEIHLSSDSDNVTVSSDSAEKKIDKLKSPRSPQSIGSLDFKELSGIGEES